MLFRRACLVSLFAGLLGVAGCGHQPDNPQKRGIRAVAAPLRGLSIQPDPRIRLDPSSRPAPDVHGALLAVQTIWAHFPHPTPPAPTQHHGTGLVTPPTASVPLQVVPQGQDYHRDRDWPIWSAIGRCEQPGPGVDGIAWTHGPGSTYPGGLGIFSGAWSDYHGEAGVPVSNGAYASPEEQMMVARVIRAHHGLSAWGCAKTLGL